jgi:hypothetical protein
VGDAKVGQLQDAISRVHSFVIIACSVAPEHSPYSRHCRNPTVGRVSDDSALGGRFLSSSSNAGFP